MPASRLTALAALALLGLAGCNDNSHRAGMGGGGNGLCTPFPGATNAAGSGAAAPVAPPADGAAAMDDCLHRWGYALAASSDPADQVAEATVAACTATLARWNQQTMAPMGATRQPGGALEAPSLVTGEPTTPVAERHAYAQDRALFYVVQARAGKCAAPRVANGAPEGSAARY